MLATLVYNDEGASPELSMFCAFSERKASLNLNQTAIHDNTIPKSKEKF